MTATQHSAQTHAQHPALGPARKIVGVGVLLAGLYALGALLPFWYLTSPEAGAAFFPPAGLTFALLALTPRRTWPIWLVIVAATEMAVDLTHGQTVAMAIGFATANVVEPLIGVTALLSVMRRPRTLRQNLQLYVLCGVVIGPIFGAFVAATTATVFGNATDWLSVASKWWLGDALGVLVVATPILAWSRKSRFDTDCKKVDAVFIAVLAAVVTIVPVLVWDHPLLYAVLPVLVWAAFRGGTRAVSVAGIGVAFAAGWAAVTGRAGDLIAGGSATEKLVYVQLFLGVTVLVALTLAVEVAERRRAEYLSRRAEADRVRAELAGANAASLERRRIARETHDIVGHALNAMLLQAGAARRVLPLDADRSRDLLESIEHIGRDAFRDLDVALGLGDEPPDAFAGRGLSNVPALVGLMRQAGMRVDLDVDGDGNGSISTLVDWSAFRIIQEAMTNVTKYAPDARTWVSVQYLPDELVVAVIDDGAGTRPPPPKEGRGLIGMRERVAALGGHIDIGPNGGLGFAVRATLPVPAR